MSWSWTEDTEVGLWRSGARQQRSRSPSFFHASLLQVGQWTGVSSVRLLRPLQPKGTNAAVVVVEDGRSD